MSKSDGKKGLTYFKIWDSFIDTIDELSDEDCGILIKAAAHYAFDDEKPENLDKLLRICFSHVRFWIDEEKRLSTERSERTKKAGQASAKKRKDAKSLYDKNLNKNSDFVAAKPCKQDILSTDVNRQQQMLTYNENENENENENVNENENEKANGNGNSPLLPSSSRSEGEGSGMRERRVRDGEPSFMPPTAEEAEEYCRRNNINVDGEDFVSFYSQRNWLIDGKAIADWQAVLRCWGIKQAKAPPRRGDHHGRKKRYESAARLSGASSREDEELSWALICAEVAKNAEGG